MSSAGDSTTNQTGSPVWFGVETSIFFHDQRLCAELAKKSYHEVRSRCEVLEAGAPCWTSRIQQKFVGFASAVYERKLYRVVSPFEFWSVEFRRAPRTGQRQDYRSQRPTLLTPQRPHNGFLVAMLGSGAKNH